MNAASILKIAVSAFIGLVCGFVLYDLVNFPPPVSNSKAEVLLAERESPWQSLVDAFNLNFDRLAELSCSQPVPKRYIVGDLLTAGELNSNFRVIIDALEKGGCAVPKSK